MTNQQRRTARGATRRPAPGPRRRTAHPHDRTTSTSRSGTARKKAAQKRIPVNRTAPRGPRDRDNSAPRPILKTLTKFVARAVLGIVILAIFVFGVFPTGSYVEQRNELNDAEQELTELRAENADLEDRVERLESDEAIENKARADYGLEGPDDESYLILPPGR